MQANTIAYTFDHDNDGGTTPAVSVTLTRHQEELHKSTYTTGAHLVEAPDTMAIYRTLPKRSGDYLGSLKVSAKRTATVTVDNAAGLEVKAPSITEVAFSLPVGMTNAQKLSGLMELIGFLSSSEGKAAMIKLINTGEI